MGCMWCVRVCVGCMGCMRLMSTRSHWRIRVFQRLGGLVMWQRHRVGNSLVRCTSWGSFLSVVVWQSPVTTSMFVFLIFKGLLGPSQCSPVSWGTGSSCACSTVSVSCVTTSVFSMGLMGTRCSRAGLVVSVSLCDRLSVLPGALGHGSFSRVFNRLHKSCDHLNVLGGAQGRKAFSCRFGGLRKFM